MNHILPRFAMLFLATVGFASAARASTLTICHYIDSAFEKQDSVVLGTGASHRITRYGYDYSSHLIISGGKCTISAATNSIVFSSVSKDTLVNVVWTPWKYTLAYDANEGTWMESVPAEIEAKFGEKATAYGKDACTRTGHTLGGWNTKSDGTGSAVSLSQTLTMGTPPMSNDTRSVTLYAQWQVNQYPLHLKVGTGIGKIFYKVNGAASWAETAADLDVSVDYGTTWLAYAEAKPGYRYDYYTSENPYEHVMNIDGGSFSPAAAAKTFELRFWGNGETSGSTETQSFTYDVGNYLNTCKFVRGYTVSFDSKGGTDPQDRVAKYGFAGWNDKADGSGAYSYGDAQMVTNPCGSTGETVWLYAQWNTNAMSSIVLPTATKTGCTFAGWYADYDLTVPVGKAGATYVPTNDVTLYAKWDTLVYTVTFRDGHKQAGDAVIAAQQVAYGQAATPPEPPSHDYSRFTGWDKSDYQSVTADMTIRALYEDKEYQVYYQSNYRNGQTEKTYTSMKCGPSISREGGDEITLKDAKSVGFDKAGHTFQGWDWNAEATVPYWKANDTMTYVVIDEHPDAKLYAIWSPISYTVAYDGNGATGGATEGQTFQYGEAKALNANGFTRTGQTFLRWHDEANDRDYAEGQTVSNLTATAGGTVTLKAVWSNFHYVRFDRNGATNAAEMALQTFSGAETNALSANAYGKVGYTFAGWATSTNDAQALAIAYTNRQEASFPQAQPGETNVLYAAWSTNRYTICFDPATNGLTAANSFFGTMAPVTNCAYDTTVTIRCGYTNYCSQGLLGWSRTSGATTADYKVTSQSPQTQGSDAVVSNLTADANGRVVLYPVWADVGDLSRAAGLTNAVLFNVSSDKKCFEWATSTKSGLLWDTNHDERVSCSNPWYSDQYDTPKLVMKVRGRGTLRFRWCSRLYNQDQAQFWLKTVSAETETTTNLYATSKSKLNWDAPVELRIFEDGEHEISWELSATLRGTSYALKERDIIAVDDVTWTPGTPKHIITVKADPAIGGTVSGGGQYAGGDTVELVATPNPGYAFARWADDATAVARRQITVTGDATYTACFTGNAYRALSLRFGRGIELIHYTIGGVSSSTNADADIWMAHGTEWSASAQAKAGYTTDATASGTMDVGGALFAPEATPNAISVTYDRGLGTGGEMEPSEFRYDTPANLSANAFVRTYRVTFDANGGTVTNANGTAMDPAATNGVYAFAGWATSAADAAAGRVAFADGQSVTNLSTGAPVTLYATWTTNAASVVALPGATRDDYTFEGWKHAGINFVAGYRFIPTNNMSFAAQWKVVLSELSEAVGLTNAVLKAVEDTEKNVSWRCAEGSARELDWDYGHSTYVKLDTSSLSKLTSLDASPLKLYLNLSGRGKLSYRIYGIRSKTGSTTSVQMLDIVGAAVTTNVVFEGGSVVNWAEITYELTADGPHEIRWLVSGKAHAQNKIAIDDMTWTPSSSVKPGGEMPTYATKEAAEAAAKATKVLPPNDEVAAVVDADEYNDMFEVKAVQKASAGPQLLAADAGGEWTLVIELKPAVSNEVQQALDVAETNLCSVITNNPISVSVAMKPGLYYGLAGAAAVTNAPTAVPASWVLGTGAVGQSVSADRPSDDAAFYRMRMAITPPEAGK